MSKGVLSLVIAYSSVDHPGGGVGGGGGGLRPDCGFHPAVRPKPQWITPG